MKRAAELFTLKPCPSGSPLVEDAWLTRSEPAARFLSVAAAHWEMVVTRRADTTLLTVRGPETRATTVPIPADAEFFGIQFSAGTFMPGLPPGDLVDRAVALPVVAGAFRLGGAEWPVPGPDDVDGFVQGLAQVGLLEHDPVVAQALRSDVRGWSTRSVQRRVARATGLDRSAIRRIRRSEQAVELLSRGVPPAEVAVRAGYADQAHLTRSLRRLVGQSPAKIRRSAGG